MNNKPKRLFKKIEEVKNEDAREALVQKYVRIVKKTAGLDQRAMIDIFSTDNKCSAQLF